MVSFLLENNCDPNYAESPNYSAFELLCQSKSITVSLLKVFLEHEADLLKKNHNQRIPLFYICHNDQSDSQMLELLLGIKNLLCGKTQEDIISLACRLDDLDQLNKILQHPGYDPFIKYLNDVCQANDILHLALKCNRQGLKIVKYLVEEQDMDLFHIKKGSEDYLNCAFQHCTNLETLKWLMDEKGMDLNKVDKWGDSSVEQAFLYNTSVEVIRWLVEEKGVDVNHRKQGKSPNEKYTRLQHAFHENSSLDVLKYLARLEQSDILVKTTNGVTLLEFAFSEGRTADVELVTLLLDRKIQVNKLDENSKVIKDESCLHMALHHKAPYEVIKFLMERKASVNALNEYNATPLHASAGQEVEIIKLLIDAKSDLNVKEDEDDQTPVQSIVQSAKDTEILEYLPDELHFEFCDQKRAEKGEEPLHLLHLACQYKPKLSVVKFLVEKGCDINHWNERFQGNTPLHYALEQGGLDVVKYLLDRPSVDVNVLNEYESTPLLCVFRRNKNLEVFQYLAKKRPELFENHNKQKLINIACINEPFRIVRFLCESHFGTPEDWKHSVFWACSNWHSLEIVKYLAGEKGFSSNVKNSNGNTCLHESCNRTKDALLVKFLVEEKGMDINAQNNDGETPLMVATKEGNDQIVFALLALGCNRTLLDNEGKSFRDLADKTWNKEVKKVLEQEEHGKLWDVDHHHFFSKETRRRVCVVLLSSKVLSRKMRQIIPKPILLQIIQHFVSLSLSAPAIRSAKESINSKKRKR